jgi:hypothetical protein
MLRSKILRKILRSKPQHTCCKCPNKAVWKYAPADTYPSGDPRRFYCEEHVSRGCSCNRIDLSDPNSEEEHKDPEGRLLPCCEYDWNDEGYVIQET